MSRFGDDDGYILGSVDDLHMLLRAIDETMPKDAVLYVEGTRADMAPEIGEFLAAHAAPAGMAIAAGTVYPMSTIHRMPLAGSNLTELRALAELHPAPEVCEHLVVYRGGELLLGAYDAGYGWLEIAHSLPAETIDRLRRELGPALGPPPETDTSGV